ncbi:glycerol kinase-like [Macadamia integrifolia]|uniref:glycerol kinase-like n=1 Tax=Macadamia integrifolia TaxID=60698 RepID=UPI001C4E60EC|nr:glycerol kinase-like [Macadamia integrifolia]XP_042486084.1 glycerol kinase-like [Macadamia integrifolia]XP_042486085.1 glycerol kinase-like [Macadamia integrifolia]
MSKKEAFIGAIDQGTTSTRFIIYDQSYQVIGSHQIEFTQFFPQAGWVEHNPMEILESVRVCMAKAIDRATADGHNVDGGLKAIGVTNQRETTVVWSKSTGLPLHNAIVWMDVRTSTICRRLEEQLPGEKYHFMETCGLPISTYFSAVKLLWLLENVDAVKIAVESGDALFGTIETWLIWNLTGGSRSVDSTQNTVMGLHVTDVSNASRTMLMNLKTLDWDIPTLETLGIPIEILPKIISNSEIIGNIGRGWPTAGVPIAGCLGDQHAAMVGQACRKGEAKSTYGTGAFILLNTGEEIIRSNHGLLSTIAYKLGPNAPTNFALEGSIAIAGAAVQWLRDSLGIIQTAPEIEDLAKKVDNSGGVYFVPAFNGLFAPWWKDDARGVLVGITRFTNRSHIARAVLESICFQANDVLDSMHKDSKEKAGVTYEEFLLRVDGGASANNLLMQIQANLLGSPVVRPSDIETTALGAAYAAGLAVGVWTEDEIFSTEKLQAKATTFHPKLEEEHRKKKVESWYKTVTRSFDLANLSL